MKLLWVSNSSWSKTGYGVQTNLFTTRLTESGHPCAVLAYHGLEGGVINFGKVLHFPKHIHPYGMDIASAHAHVFQADAILTLMDSWVIEPNKLEPFKWIAYYPIDHQPIPPKVRESITHAHFRIAMSKYGVEETRKSGLDCYYVPHAVNTELYKPTDKKEAREIMGLPKDAYIIGTVAMNKGLPSRKCFPSMLHAFADFKRKHTDAVYYIHTQEGVGRDGLGGVNIPEMCYLLGLKYGQDVILPNPHMMMLGFTDEAMSYLYSSMDVHLLASMGEGFGVPIIEAQSCGVPVIVGGWTAMPELVASGRIIEKKDAEPIWTGLASYQFVPKKSAIEHALNAEFMHPSKKEQARKFIIENYDIEPVYKNYMLPIINAIEKRIMDERGRWQKVAEERKNGK